MSTDLLLVDADADHRSGVVAALERRGFLVREADRVQSAAGALDERVPEVLVVAAPLPDRDALEWLTALRASGLRLPVVAYLSRTELDADTFRVLRRDLAVAIVSRAPVAAVPFADEVVSACRLARPRRGGDTIESRMAALRGEFAAELPGRVKALGAVLGGEATRDDVTAARSIAHGLRGTSAIYGLLDVAAAATELEDALDAVLADDPAAPPTTCLDWPHARDAMDRVEAAAREAVKAFAGP